MDFLLRLPGLALLPVGALAGDHVSIGVAADDVRTWEARYAFQDANRIRADRREVSEDEKTIDPSVRPDVIEHGVERDRVSVDVREDREAHSRTIEAG